MLSSMLQTVCRSLSDSNQVVRSAGLFALGQFSEHLQVNQETHHKNLKWNIWCFLKFWFYLKYTLGYCNL